LFFLDDSFLLLDAFILLVILFFHRFKPAEDFRRFLRCKQFRLLPFSFDAVCFCTFFLCGVVSIDLLLLFAVKRKFAIAIGKVFGVIIIEFF